MGLDMYLSKKTYVRIWDWEGTKQKNVIQCPERPLVRADRVNYVIEEIMYWRKANAIHHWFVENVQHGVDDCGEYPVSWEQLKMLCAQCASVLAVAHTTPGKLHEATIYSGGTVTENWVDGDVITNPAAVAAILPTQEGFFFGGTDYNEWYLDSIRETYDVLSKELTEETNEFAQYYYSSSW